MKSYPFSGPYTDSDGIEYESYEAYCNSLDLDTYTVMLKLYGGQRKPQNASEERMLAEMRQIEESGGMIDFSENIP